MQHPAVLEAAVFGIPSEKWGESPVAAVTLSQFSDGLCKLHENRTNDCGAINGTISAAARDTGRGK